MIFEFQTITRKRKFSFCFTFFLSSIFSPFSLRFFKYPLWKFDVHDFHLSSSHLFTPLFGAKDFEISRNVKLNSVLFSTWKLFRFRYRIDFRDPGQNKVVSRYWMLFLISQNISFPDVNSILSHCQKMLIRIWIILLNSK